MKNSGIQRLQTYLNGNGNNLIVDGQWGAKSKKAYLLTWKDATSAELKDIGFVEWERIKHASRHPKVTKVGNLQENFIVGIGAGHSGVFGNDWIYPTAPSKMYRHNKLMHFGNTFYEGYENRVVSEMLIRELTYKGIQTVRLYDATLDTKPSMRALHFIEMLNAGYFGVAIDIHSNAIDGTPEQKENTQGSCIYTSIGENKSDQLSDYHYESWKEVFGFDMNIRANKYDPSGDYEANFSFLKYADQGTPDCIAMLEEFGFFTSQQDAEFIINNRERRVEALVRTILKAKHNLFV
jgi:hypothetical protein